MTAEERKMKKYTKAIGRRLELPREIRARVMSDFISSIEARRESGMTDEEIYGELGNAKKAAADLNEQMKEYTYRKSPWRFLFLLAALWGAWEFLGGVLAVLLYLMMGDPFGAVTDAASMGIIGGADGPTAIFVTWSVPTFVQILVPALLLAVGIWGFLRLRKCKQK